MSDIVFYFWGEHIAISVQFAITLLCQQRANIDSSVSHSPDMCEAVLADIQTDAFIHTDDLCVLRHNITVSAGHNNTVKVQLYEPWLVNVCFCFLFDFNMGSYHSFSLCHIHRLLKKMCLRLARVFLFWLTVPEPLDLLFGMNQPSCCYEIY